MILTYDITVSILKLMLSTSIIPARNLQKSYKSIIEDVKVKKQPVVLTTNNKPQAAIVSLEDLEKIKQVKVMQSALEMLKLASESREELRTLPSDLRDRTNEILYSKS